MIKTARVQGFTVRQGARKQDAASKRGCAALLKCSLVRQGAGQAGLPSNLWVPPKAKNHNAGHFNIAPIGLSKFEITDLGVLVHLMVLELSRCAVATHRMDSDKSVISFSTCAALMLRTVMATSSGLPIVTLHSDTCLHMCSGIIIRCCIWCPPMSATGLLSWPFSTHSTGSSGYTPAVLASPRA